MTILLL